MQLTADVVQALRNPARIAILGASRDPSKPSGRPIRFMREFGFRGEIVPIAPTGDEVQGIRSYRSLAEAPAPDLVIVSRPAEEVNDLVRDSAAAGARAAVVFAAGFAEFGVAGSERQQQLAATATRPDKPIRVIGPNCLGFAHLSAGVTATFASGLEGSGRIPGGGALVTQSGGFGAAMYSAATAAGVGFSWFVTTGNEVDVTVGDVVDVLVDEDDVDYLLVYVERIRQAVAFTRALAKAAAAGKPVVVFTAGTSVRGAQAALSHTGSLSDTRRIYPGLLDQLGAIAVDSIEAMIDVARGLQIKGPITGQKVTIVTASGGAGIVMTDACEASGLVLGDWDREWRDRASAGLPPFASVGNPIDTTASPGLPALGHAIATAAAHPGTDVVIAMMENIRADEARRLEIIRDVAVTGNKPVVVSWTGGDAGVVGRMADVGILGYSDPLRTARAIAALSRAARTATSKPDGTPIERAVEMIDAGRRSPHAGPWLRRGDGRAVLDSQAGRELLSSYGVSVPARRVVASAVAAMAAAAEIGYPVAMKIDSPEITHKARTGGVVLNVTDADEVARAYHRLSVLTDTIAVEQMLSVDREFLVGMISDDEFGPIMLIGSGGTAVELIGDVHARLPPLSADEARDAIRSTTVASAGGELSEAAAGVVVQAVVGLSRLLTDHRADFTEVDVNPLILGGAATPEPFCAAVDWLFCGR